MCEHISQAMDAFYTKTESFVSVLIYASADKASCVIGINCSVRITGISVYKWKLHYSSFA